MTVIAIAIWWELSRRSTIPRTILLAIILNHALLFLFTALSLTFKPFLELSWSLYLPYVAISAVFLMDLRNVKVAPNTNALVGAAHLVNILLGVLSVIDWGSLRDIFIAFYSIGTVDVAESLLAENKPILFFGSHSIASLYFYLFFYSAIRSFESSRKLLYLIISIGYMMLLPLLSSVSSVILFVIASIQLLLQLGQAKWIVLCFVMVIFTYFAADLLEFADSIVIPVLTAPGAGFLGRYSPDGVLFDTIEYLFDNPFLPLGITWFKELWLTDSGYVLFLLQGSIFTTASMYACLYIFLVRNLRAKSDAYWIFCVIMAFEVGYPSLLYQRMWYLLPFLAIYLNGIQPDAKTPSAGARCSTLSLQDARSGSAFRAASLRFSIRCIKMVEVLFGRGLSIVRAPLRRQARWRALEAKANSL